MEKGSIDIVFCGKQAIDGDTAQVGPGIASRLGIPQLTYVEKVKFLNLKNNTLVIHRKIDNGYEVVESKLPCLITVENVDTLPHLAIKDQKICDKWISDFYF